MGAGKRQQKYKAAEANLQNANSNLLRARMKLSGPNPLSEPGSSRLGNDYESRKDAFNAAKVAHSEASDKEKGLRA